MDKEWVAWQLDRDEPLHFGIRITSDALQFVPHLGSAGTHNMGAPKGHTILFVALLLCFTLTTHTVLCSEQSKLVIRVSVSINFQHFALLTFPRVTDD